MAHSVQLAVDKPVWQAVIVVDRTMMSVGCSCRQHRPAPEPPHASHILHQMSVLLLVVDPHLPHGQPILPDDRLDGPEAKQTTVLMHSPAGSPLGCPPKVDVRTTKCWIATSGPDVANETTTNVLPPASHTPGTCASRQVFCITKSPTHATEAPVMYAMSVP